MPARLRRMRACCMLGEHFTAGAFSGRWAPSLCIIALLADAAASAGKTNEENFISKVRWWCHIDGAVKSGEGGGRGAGPVDRMGTTTGGIPPDSGDF